MAALGLCFWDACSTFLVLRGLEGRAVGHFCHVYALHVRVGQRLMDTLAQRQIGSSCGGSNPIKPAIRLAAHRHRSPVRKALSTARLSLLSRFPAACMREAQAALSWRRSQRQCRSADPCSNPQLITCPGNSSFLSRHPRRPTPHQGTLCWSLDDSSLASFRCLLRKRSLAEGRRTLSNK